MLLFPAIDLYEGKAVRLLKGDYSRMTVYSGDPLSVARDFVKKGMHCIHLVDLEGARDGGTPNLDTVVRIKTETGMFCEIGGGIRSLETIERYLDAGLDRVILGTAAVTDEGMLRQALSRWNEKIAVGVDIRDGFVAIKGWEEKTELEAFAFVKRMRDLGVNTFICTDISKDGAMQGTNRNLYRQLMERFDVNITASGGISSLDDLQALSLMGLYGAIVGKAYYTGDIDLERALEVTG
ncbi:MAG: 1-(5-phosphoribosyl)-5-[Clostridia bacterium]|nr:1-(5-phosphoribosyl)-5-[(5-phosphoribosylamino)methylideneamino]imidazole-4-carboxamide isomerase [Clostridia bacterium]